MTDAGSADLSNWRRAPFNRWAFHHVEEVVPCAQIAADPARRQEWEVAPVSFGDFDLKLPGGRSLDLAQWRARTWNDALVVTQHGRIVYEVYAGGMTAASRHILMSASKSVIGLLCGVLVDRGLLRLDAVLADVLPEIAASVYGSVTPRDLLDMTVAPGFDSATLEAYAAAAGWDPAPSGRQGSGLHDFFAGLPAAPTVAPRGPFAYVSANTDLLGWVIERTTGRTVAQLIGELIWTPMGASDAACITVDRQGAPRCTGGICSSARDLARIGQLLLDRGASGGRQVVSAAWVDDIFANGDSDAWARGEFAASFGLLNMHYRSGWYAMRESPSWLFAMGIHGQNLFIDLANRITIAVFSSQPEPVEPLMAGLTLRAVAEIRRLLAAT